MANFLESALDYVKQTVWDQPVGIVKNVAKGDFSGAFDDWKHTFGDNNDGEEKIFNSLGIRGWVGSHPTETAGAVVGSILGGMYAAGAYGAGAAGSAGGAAGASTGGAAGAAGTGAGAGTAGFGSGVGMAYTPSAALGGSSGLGSAGTGALSYAPTQSAVLSGTGSQGIAAGAGTGALSYAPTQSAVLGGAGSGAPANFGAGLGGGSGSGFDAQQFIRGLSQMNSALNQNGGSQQTQVSAAAIPRSSFNFQAKESQGDKARKLLQQTLGTNPYNYNQFINRK